MTNKKNLGIYIHIPFCIKKCDYCDFYSIEKGTDYINSYVNSLINEIDSYRNFIKNKYVISSIYFGGGTPSLLSYEDINRILAKIYEFDVLNDIEITLECNPETLSKTYLEEIYTTKVNRLSIGMQSLSDEMLKNIGRIHTKEKFIQEYNNARAVGFENISIDLMFGFYNQTLDDLRDTLKNVVLLNPTHISSYSLILEENTKMYEDVKNGRIDQIDEDLERQMYLEVTTFLQENGYIRYEISNYAKEGYSSKHNTSYWENVEYLGIGSSASSYFMGARYKNENDLHKYINANGIITKVDYEKIDRDKQIEEFFFLGLRTKKGVSYSDFYNRFEKSIDDYFKNEVESLIKDGFLIKENDVLLLTDKGFDFSNYISSKFIL